MVTRQGAVKLARKFTDLVRAGPTSWLDRARGRSLDGTTQPLTAYAKRVAAERKAFDSVSEVHDLPPIAHYWSDKYIRPMVEEFGFNMPEQLFAKYLALSAARAGGTAVFLSLGAGNCDTEVRTAQLLRAAGLVDFVIECLELNPQMIERGRELASHSGVLENLAFVECDFNHWTAAKTYTAMVANQVLHHVLELEHLFSEVKRSLHPAGYFVTGDMIGRNGHQRWPEALEEVRRYWRELPADYRWNRLMNRYEEEYINHDCSTESFEGIRAQDVLPLLIRDFDFEMFVPFGNVIDPFVDRCFGQNFDANEEWDRAFIDRVHAFDEQAILSGALTPTHMYAAMKTVPCTEHHYSRGLSPERCVRRKIPAPTSKRLEIVTALLRARKSRGKSYAMTLAASGGTPPYTWLAADLPPGLALSVQGILSGTLETSGGFAPLITVSDSSHPPQAVAQRYTILEKHQETPLPLAILEPAALPRGMIGVKYAAALRASGGTPPLEWSLAGGLVPRGLHLDRAKGVISGEPLATSSSVFAIQVSDASGQSASKDLELRIEPPDSVSSRTGIFPHLACGGGWRTSLVLANPEATETRLAIDVRSSSGRRLHWSLEPPPTDCSCHFSGHYLLAPHASLRIEVAPGQKEAVSGWAEVSSTGHVTGHATFHYAKPGNVRSEVTLPLETASYRELRIPFDNQAGNRTGVAFLNLSSSEADALVTAIWDEAGELVSTPTIPLAGGRHLAFALSDRCPDTVERRGIIDVRAASGAPVHVIALRMSPEGVFSLLPQIAASSSPDVAKS